MWQQVTKRAADVGGSKGFTLPGAQKHYAPDRQAEIDRIVIEIWVDAPAGPRIRGRVRIALAPLARTDRLVLDAAELEIRSVSDDRGRPLAFELEDGRLNIDLGSKAKVGEAISLSIDYDGAPRRGLYFIGPNAFDQERPVEVWTQGQDDDSRHWFPCFDFPNQKAKTELIAHVPKGLFALSNGVLIEERDSGQQTVFHYRQETPHSTYLVSLVVGDYTAIEDRAAEVPVVSYVHPRDLERGRLTFSRTAKMVELFAERIGIPYPYPRYSQICVADFIFGGMENTTATTLTDQILFDKRSEADFRKLSEGLIAHELAHQWWGDLVTCVDWSHAWLNEGFATYFETIWLEASSGADEAAYARFIDQEAYFAERYRRPLVERTYEEPIDLFDRHQYEKGACVLHMIRAALGDDAFWRALNHYGTKHRGKTVETTDLRRAIEETTGKNLEQLFDQWVLSPGHPDLTISGRWDAGQKTFELTVEQKQKEMVFNFEVDVRVVTATDSSTQRIEIDSKKKTYHLPAEMRPDYVLFDAGSHVTKQVENRLPADMLRAMVVASDDVINVVHGVRTLVKRQDPASLEAVFQVLRDHTFHGVRTEAAKALGKSLSSDTQEALVDAVIEDGDPRVRRAAIRALAAFKRDAEEVADILIRHADSETSDYAIADAVRTVADLRADSSAAFVDRALQLEGHNHCIRAAAVESLARLRDLDGLPKLLEAAESTSHARVREAAISAIGQLGAYAPQGSIERTEAADRLLMALDDPWLRVRIRAADALTKLGESRAIRALEEHATKELDGRARRAMRLAAQALRKRSPRSQEVDRLQAELEELRRTHSELMKRVARLEAKAGKKKKKKKKKK